MFDQHHSSHHSSGSQGHNPRRVKRVAQRSTRPAGRAQWQASLVVAKAHNRLMRTDERGDVPGWVLITLMSAGLVVALWAIAGPALEGLFNDAISKITNQAG